MWRERGGGRIGEAEERREEQGMAWGMSLCWELGPCAGVHAVPGVLVGGCVDVPWERIGRAHKRAP